jgi:pimeloyl-ACP methyl ester carboxylesterase
MCSGCSTTTIESMTAVAQRAQTESWRMKVHAVRGGGGLQLHVREWGRPDGPPILFIHGWSQNHLCWAKQYESALADEFRLVAYDLRGHGMSEAPLEPEHYTEGRRWADDVAAIIDELALDRPVLVGWSYGSFVICDYIRAYGQERVAAINFVEAAVRLGEAAFGTLIGPGFLDHFVGTTADDLPTNIGAMRSFVRTCFAKPVSNDDLETACVGTSSYQRRSAPISWPARSTATTCCGLSGCRCSSRRAEPTQSSYRRWPSTCSPPAQPARRPGTTAAVTFRTWRMPSASTASWPN